MVSFRARNAMLAIGLVTIAASAVLWRAARTDSPAVDFSAVWLAGAMWNAGMEPYSADFTSFADRFFPPPAHHPLSWVYPAQWMFPARIFARFDFNQAKAIWLALSATALAASIIIFWRTAEHLNRPPSAVVKAGIIVFMLSMESIGGSLFLGQTSFLMLLGVALLLHGFATDRPVPVTIGLILLLLKPQFGVVFIGAAMAVKRLRLPVVMAILITSLACLLGHAISPLGVVDSISQWLGALGRYGDEPYNTSAALAGLNLINSGVFGIDFSSLFYTGVAAIAAPIMMHWLSQNARLPTLEAFWLSSVSTLTVVAPLHVYDFSLAATLLFMLPAFNRPQRICLIGGTLLLHRARMIGGWIAPDTEILHSQAAVATLGDVLLFAMMLMFCIATDRKQTHAI